MKTLMQKSFVTDLLVKNVIQINYQFIKLILKQKFRIMNILVTGSKGFIGSNLIRYLKKQNES